MNNKVADKFVYFFQWLKEKWFLVVGGLLGIAAIFLIKPRNKIVSSARKNAELEAKIYDLSKAASKRLDEEVGRIDNETEAKMKKLQNSKKKISAKFQQQKEDRAKELSGKTAEELAEILRAKKD